MSYLTPFFNFPLFSAQGHNYCLFLPIYANISHLFLSFSSSQPFSGTVQPYDSKSLLFPFGQMSSPGMQVTRERNVHTLSFSVSERWREKWRLLREKKYSSKFQMSWREELPFVTESFKRKGRAFCKNLHHRFFLQARGWHIRTSQTP